MQKEWPLKKPLVKNDFGGLVSDVGAAILAHRGITTKEEAEEIILPNYLEHLPDPFLMKDMAAAVERILSAITLGEKILIFGDYDADGVPATAILAEFFTKIGYANFDIYIPHRHNEQYGLSVAAVEKFHEQGVKLIITVDCGISNLEEIKRAGELGMEVIVTDHHLPPVKLPPAVAIVDPKQADCHYPYKHLCGSGVAFKLIQALIARGGFTDISPGWEKWLLELVAIATVADMVPLTGENKILVKFGLMVLRLTRRPGLMELLRVLKLRREHLVEDDIGFMIGPRLNSAGRMAHALEAYRLLVTADGAEAAQIATNLEKMNKARRGLVAEILALAEKKYQGVDLPAVLVLGDEEWGLGVLGLAAARLAEKYQRTVFVWAKNGNGEIKGSCRSGGEVNVVELMKHANKPAAQKLKGSAGRPPFFRDYGGHAFAGGFSLPAENLPKLEKKLLTAYAKAAKTVVVEEEEVDWKITLDEVDWRLQKEVEKLGPYGLDFEKPVFWLEDLAIKSVRAFGADGAHLELKFAKPNGEEICAISFFSCDPSTGFSPDQGHIWPGVNLAPGRRVDMLANIEKSTYRARPELRLRIVDLRQDQ